MKRKAAAKRVEAPADAAELSPVSAGKPADELSIRARAYDIWVEEGQPHGRDVEHWLRARDELSQTTA